ncbi:hypothetical protein SH203_02090 [Brevundimonas sp. SH203]|uniref:DUF1674 domain-containing protein n=1 Tax=Brevundimonas sp. SH203 TaxID=345167 RepID=UPI0009D24C83|nr:DUF1674 domain-containing protein [Brevundimonas sp. SH203]GAW41681.1 hypothetical protein SH203_02090 [Brevundimonas sp. SH203]
MTEHPTPAPDGDDQTAPTGPVFNADVPHATPERPLSEAARRALQEAADRRAKQLEEAKADPEHGGPRGPEPTRFGDWEKKGIAVDF